MIDQLTINVLLKYKNEENRIERVLWIDFQEDIIFLINILDNEWPQLREISEIIELINLGEIEVLNIDKNFRILKEEDISEKDKKKRDKAYEIILELYEKVPEPLVFIRKERAIAIKELLNKYKVSRNTIDNYLKRYWKRGNVKNALLADYYKCGGLGKERNVGDLKRGRPRKFIRALGCGINIDEEIKRIFRIAVNRYYNTSKKNSLVNTYQLMLRDFFSEDYKIKNGIKIPLIKDRDDIPSLEQFRYWFNKERNLKREISLRQSAKLYEQKHRAILGNSRTEALAPASIYQIDATVADVYLVSRYNRNWIIGRPIIYSILDTYSNMIVGLNVSLEGPSWVGAMMALSNAMTDKVSFCKSYGIDIEEHEWPVKYLPDSILADRGELEGYNIETLVSNLGIKVSNTPSFRADWKGCVEQYFRLTNLKVKPFVPGAINSDFRERGEKDYRLDAKLDIYQFTQIIIKCALYHNNQHILKSFNRDELMIKDDIEPIPINIWNWGIKNSAGRLRVLPEEIVKLNLMPKDTATISEKGIRFKGVLYGAEVALKERWFEKARNKGNWRIEVSYDPRNLNFIYIIDKNGMGYEKCFLLKHQYRYLDKTLEEVEYLFQKELLTIKDIDIDEVQAKIDLVTEIEEIVKEAEDNADNNLSLSNSERLKDIRNNRIAEKIMNRENEAFDLGNQNNLCNSSKLINLNGKFEEKNDIELLRRRQKERK